MTNFIALINDDQAEEPFFGVLLFHSLIPGRFHWYVLGINDMPLIRGVVDCADDPFGENVCIDDLKQEIASKIGVAAQQIKLIDSSAADAMPYPNTVMSAA
ncbi:MAG: hypothetical protein JXA89_03570 [Anaerolineae bacterium]|nr:hypothetical protein [Anaerolineae bacterium]